MTHNQINYWNLKETERHNVVGENETARHNLAVEGETNRHNVATEGIDLGKLNESIRHNKMSEGQEDLKIAETGRHNRVTEGISQGELGVKVGNLQEQIRHNQAAEQLQGVDLNIAAGILGENIRHNQASESISLFHERSQDRLNQARSDLADIQGAWTNIQGNQKSALNAQTIGQVNQQINNLKRLTEKVGTEINLNNQAETTRIFDEIFKGVDSVSKLISSLYG